MEKLKDGELNSAVCGWASNAGHGHHALPTGIFFLLNVQWQASLSTSPRQSAPWHIRDTMKYANHSTILPLYQRRHIKVQMDHIKPVLALGAQLTTASLLLYNSNWSIQGLLVHMSHAAATSAVSGTHKSINRR